MDNSYLFCFKVYLYIVCFCVIYDIGIGDVLPVKFQRKKEKISTTTKIGFYCIIVLIRHFRKRKLGEEEDYKTEKKIKLQLKGKKTFEPLTYYVYKCVTFPKCEFNTFIKNFSKRDNCFICFTSTF